jgi:hypothetical protein
MKKLKVISLSNSSLRYYNGKSFLLEEVNLKDILRKTLNQLYNEFNIIKFKCSCQKINDNENQRKN